MQSTGQIHRKGAAVDGDFDVVVIGSGMGGLGAASALAQNGRRVLLLEQHNVVGGLAQSFERGGYRWSVGMHYIGDVATPSSLTRQIFDYATGDAIEWAHLPSIYNRIEIDGRIYAIPAGIGPYRDALVAWFPSEERAIDKYLAVAMRAAQSASHYFAQKAFPPSLRPAALVEAAAPFYEFSDRITLDVIREFTDNAELIAVLCGNWGDYGIEPTRSSFSMHAMLFKHYVNGASYPVGGGKVFAEAMVPIIERAGGQVLHSAEVEKILLADGRVSGVRLVDGVEVQCPIVVSNAGVHATFRGLIDPDAARRTGMAAQSDTVVPSGTVVGLHVGVEGRAADLALGPANIWSHPGADFAANLAAHRADFSAPFPFCFVTFGSSKDPAWDAEFPGKSTIELHAFTDYRHFAKWHGSRWMKRGADYESFKRTIEARLLDELYRLVPQVRGKVRHVETHTPVSYGSFLRRRQGEILGIESSPSRYRQQWLGAWTEIPGLYLSGQDVTNDGMIGALFGGIIAASAVLGRDVTADIKARSRPQPVGG